MTANAAERLARLTRALGELARGAHWHSHDPHAIFHALTEAASRALPVARVGVWLYDAQRTHIVCVDLYDADRDTHERGLVVHRADYPAYFVALERDRSITAHDALHDPRTRDFRESYLEPHGITSLLDAPIVVEGVSVGVVCHEQVGPQRTWSEADLTFASHIADFAALALQTALRRDAQRELAEKEEILREALDAAHMGTWRWIRDSNRVAWSENVGPLFGRPFGYEPGTFESYLSLVHPEDREAVRTTVERELRNTEGAYRLEHRISLPDGKVRWLEVRGRVLPEEGRTRGGAAGTIVDVTARHALEEQLRQAQRLDAIGKLAGGVAHDFNNLLTAILGQATLLERSLERDDASRREQLGVIREAAQRAAGLTRQLLTFSRREPARFEVLELGELVLRTGRLLERMLGEKVRIGIEVLDPSVRVKADGGQLEQVLLNLAVNARDAMDGGGALGICVGRTTLAEARPSAMGEVPPGDYASLEVVDEGGGIAPELLPSIFEPFVTTKGEGRGTGLGLSICFGIVQGAGGHIVVESALGRGTRFTVLLPLASAVVATRAEASAAPVVAGGRERVLVVEDDSRVRSLTQRLLESAGYEVTACASGEEALDLASRPASRFALAIADVVLPGVHGQALAEALRRAQPGVKLLHVSGYAAETVADAGVLPDGVPFVGKPFGRDQLLTEVRRVLDA